MRRPKPSSAAFLAWGAAAAALALASYRWEQLWAFFVVWLWGAYFIIRPLALAFADLFLRRAADGEPVAFSRVFEEAGADPPAEAAATLLWLAAAGAAGGLAWYRREVDAPLVVSLCLAAFPSLLIPFLSWPAAAFFRTELGRRLAERLGARLGAAAERLAGRFGAAAEGLGALAARVPAPPAPRAVALALAVCLWAAVSRYDRVRSLERDLDAAYSEEAKLEPIVRQVEALEQTARAVRARLAAIGDLARQREVFPRVMAALRVRNADGVALVELSRSGERVSMTLSGPSEADLQRGVAGLEGDLQRSLSPMKVQLGAAQAAGGSSGGGARGARVELSLR